MASRGGAFRGVAERPQRGGMTFMLCVRKVDLVIISVALLVMGSTLFFGQMSGLGEFLFVSGLVIYMTCRCLRSYQFLICVS